MRWIREPGFQANPLRSASRFFQQSTQVLPVVASVGPSGGQGTVGPVLSPSTLGLTFPDNRHRADERVAIDHADQQRRSGGKFSIRFGRRCKRR